MNKSFVIAEVKTLDTTTPHGEFEAILSAPTLDRDGEVVAPGAFTKAGPLPDSIPIHINHQFDVEKVVGRGVPYYDGELLKVRGTFDPDERSQLVRAKVTSGSVNRMSVGFVGASREVKDGVPTVLAAELLEASFVSVPSNREAAVLAVKHVEDVEGKGAIASHTTATTDVAWDNNANKTNLSNDAGAATYRRAFAWVDDGADSDLKGSYRFVHHMVSADGAVGAANLTACSTGIGVLNGGRGGTVIPDSGRRGVWSHLAKHLRDAGREPPELRSAPDADVKAGRVFSSKNEAALRQAVNLLSTLLDQLAAPEEAAPTKSPADADPEEKAAAPAAADEAAAAAAAQPPAEVPVGMAELAPWRAEVDLLLMD